ncbi:MAG: hypothetical protein GXN92_01055 [Candidatus Micrarchaeota archaeon]|nr:hypothetical protein [Candidatus Micrarchaeota archaeon]
MKEYIKSEIILREMVLDYKSKMDLDSLTRWLIMALGLGNPNSPALVFLLKKLLQYKFLERYLRFQDLQSSSLNTKTLYYYLHKLKQKGLVSKHPEGYTLGRSLKEPLKDFFHDYYKTRMEKALENVEKALDSFKSKTLL